MHKTIEEKIRDLDALKAAVIKTETEVILVEEVLENSYIWLDNDVNVSWPCKSMDEVKTALRQFAQAGYMISHHNKDLARPMWELEKSQRPKIVLTPSWVVQHGDTPPEGATCRLVKVGETTHKYPQYKLVCDNKEGE